MLSIGRMGNGQGTYYVGLAREDYYLEGGEPPGLWHGQSAEKLGLSGEVDREQFLRLFQGFKVDGEKLVQNAGNDKRQPGWDLTFSAPKTVSTVWACGDADLRHALQVAHLHAVKEALSYIEDEALFTRRGKNGVETEKIGMLSALFEHGTSRAQDPQLHTHALVLNIGMRADGTTGTILSKPFYRAKMQAGALYRAELANRLVKMGFELKRDGTSFEIVGVPPALAETFSKRRREIEETLSEKGQEGAKASAVAALSTRTVKEHVSRDELFKIWQLTAKAHRFTSTQVQELQQSRHGNPSEQLREALRDAGERLTIQQSHFTQRDLLRAVAEETQDKGIPAGVIRQAVKQEMTANQDFVFLAETETGEKHYTTRELLAIEEQLIENVKTLHGNQGSHTVSSSTTARAAERVEREIKITFSSEQREALSHMTEKTGGIALVSGMAGTGKTQLLKAAREAWEKEGYTVLGASVAGKAARGLEEGAGIESFTIDRFFFERERGFEYKPSKEMKLLAEYKYATWQIDNKTRLKMLGEYHKATSKFAHEFKYATWQISKSHRDFLNLQLDRERKFKMNDKTVLVIDEAGMVGTKAMAKLVSAAKETGAKLVLVGDARQLQPVEVGGAFRAIEERIGASRLTEIVRQKLDQGDKTPTWKRDAVKAFADGNAGRGLQAFRQRGFFHVKETRRGAMEELVSKWQSTGNISGSLIFAGTRDDVNQLNQLAQETRKKELGFRFVTIGKERIHEKDRIIITRSSGALKVSNGDLGTVKKIDDVRGQLVLKLDRGEEVTLPYRTFKDLSLGYAVTTHKGQGVTVDNAFILCGGSMTSREMSYVQGSRAREKTEFFTEQIMRWNPDQGKKVDSTFEELARRMSQAKQKDIGLDLRDRQRPDRNIMPELSL